MPTVPGPLPPGLKIVYAETDESQSNTTIWMASVDDLSHAQVIIARNGRQR